MDAGHEADVAENPLHKGCCQGLRRVPRTRRVAREVSDSHLEPVGDAVTSTNVERQHSGGKRDGNPERILRRATSMAVAGVGGNLEGSAGQKCLCFLPKTKTSFLVYIYEISKCPCISKILPPVLDQRMLPILRY